MPHTSNPSSRALALMDSEESMDYKPGTQRVPFFASVSGDELPEYVRQDSAVAECHQLLRRVDPDERLKFDGVIADRSHVDVTHRLEAVLDARDLEDLAAGELQ